jgi:hypothetical protein
LRQIVKQPADPDATDFLIIGEREMQRNLECGARNLRQQRQCHAEKAFHIRGATAIKSAVANRGLKRIARPVLAVHRHDIGMARQDIAAIA